jgi:hypothetical protein
MENYPPEIVEFPLPLVALVGYTSLHVPIKKYASTRKDLTGKDVSAYNFVR